MSRPVLIPSHVADAAGGESAIRSRLRRDRDELVSLPGACFLFRGSGAVVHWLREEISRGLGWDSLPWKVPVLSAWNRTRRTPAFTPVPDVISFAKQRLSWKETAATRDLLRSVDLQFVNDLEDDGPFFVRIVQGAVQVREEIEAIVGQTLEEELALERVRIWIRLKKKFGTAVLIELEGLVDRWAMEVQEGISTPGAIRGVVRRRIEMAEGTKELPNTDTATQRLEEEATAIERQMRKTKRPDEMGELSERLRQVREKHRAHFKELGYRGMSIYKAVNRGPAVEVTINLLGATSEPLWSLVAAIATFSEQRHPVRHFIVG